MFFFFVGNTHFEAAKVYILNDWKSETHGTTLDLSELLKNGHQLLGDISKNYNNIFLMKVKTIILLVIKLFRKII